MSSEQAPADASTREVIMPSSLTAENGAKALLIGEFSETVEVRNELYCGCGYCDFCEENPDEPETCQISVPVSWNTIKAIYAKAVQHLSKPLPTDRDDENSRLKAEIVQLTELNRRALAIITDAIMCGMPITEEVADVRNKIVGCNRYRR